jgi:aldose 1-epimerase
MKKIVIMALASLLLASCDKCDAPILIPETNFQTTVDGKEVSLYTLQSGDITMQVTNFGARVVALWTPDREGKYDDIVLGYNHIDRYVNNSGERFLGAVVGPYANRIANGTYSIGEEAYHFPQNNNGQTLHGGLKGLDMVVWDVKEVTENSIVFFYLRPHGQDGMPGNLAITMTYTLTPENEFKVEYLAQTDKATHVNISHHSFFNLKGEGNGTINDHVLYINASLTTPVDSVLIPTGEIVKVEGTAFDFCTPKAIGQDLEVEDEQLKKYLNRCLFDCILPLIDGDEARQFAADVLARFANPYIKHRWQAISLNSVSKFKVRVLPSILEYIRRKNQLPKRLIFSFAKLIEFYKYGTPNDDPAIIETMKNASIAQILANTEFWDEDLSFLTEAVEKAAAEGQTW